uniref:Small ribosomal subunit protein uS11c n=1 Tax=Lecanorchis japonica TaxID=915449 RepID=A0A6G7KVM8_9ASPA|nr:ribosomal protein S11 [Lecanorchis japonica]QII89414.1 ribosomal protein S11 [Lecanorchis japonica]
MTKPIVKIGLRKNVRIELHKSKRIIPKAKGIIHVQASLNNTIVTVTDVIGRVVSWASAGASGFRSAKKGTPYAAQAAALNAIRTAVGRGINMKQTEVMIKGTGLGRDATLRVVRRSGILLNFVRDVTPMPHNGCRPPKKRRV